MKTFCPLVMVEKRFSVAPNFRTVFLPQIVSLYSVVMLHTLNSEQPRDEQSLPGLHFIQGSGPNMADIL